jgi:hypothetical protein
LTASPIRGTSADANAEHDSSGATGNERLVQEYGAQLLFVRYRVDEERGRRCKTVELIVNERPLRPGHTVFGVLAH